MKIHCGQKELDLSSPQIMGILNVTPDSFSDGGELFQNDQPLLEQIYMRAQSMVDAGAKILDVGGESTRPGAPEVSLEQELERVLPVVEMLKDLPVIISVDTSKPEVMRQVIAAGAHMINDVRALSVPGAIEAVAPTDVAVCLMHMQGQPETMQQQPTYTEIGVVDTVSGFLKQRILQCEKGGLSKKRLILDPGFGFGKTLDHNLSLLKNLQALSAFDLPLLVGISRKSMLGQLLDLPDEQQRLAGSLTAGIIALQRGAHILRVHDVEENYQAIKILNALSAAH